MTQNQLDDNNIIHQDDEVNRFISTLSLGAAMLSVLTLSTCGPQAADPDKLRAVHEQNAELRREINHMQALIKHAGEITPGLDEEIEKKEADIAAKLHELNELNRKETDTKLRIIELQDRLESFRSTFRIMQDEIANQRS